jgi:hypothetical protein
MGPIGARVVFGKMRTFCSTGGHRYTIRPTLCTHDPQIVQSLQILRDTRNHGRAASKSYPGRKLDPGSPRPDGAWPGAPPSRAPSATRIGGTRIGRFSVGIGVGGQRAGFGVKRPLGGAGLGKGASLELRAVGGGRAVGDERALGEEVERRGTSEMEPMERGHPARRPVPGRRSRSVRAPPRARALVPHADAALAAPLADPAHPHRRSPRIPRHPAIGRGLRGTTRRRDARDRIDGVAERRHDHLPLQQPGLV